MFATELIFDADGRNQLHRAAIYGNLSAVEDILENVPIKNIDILDNSSRTPLHYAVKNDHFDIAIALLKAGSNALGMQDARGKTPLHLIPKNIKDLSMLTEILKKASEEDLNKKDRRHNTPLLLAVQKNNMSIVDLLIEYKPELLKIQYDHRDVDCLHHLIVVIGALNNYMREEIQYKYTNENMKKLLYIHRDTLGRVCSTHNTHNVKEGIDFSMNVFTDMLKILEPEALEIQDKKGRTPLHILAYLFMTYADYQLIADEIWISSMNIMIKMLEKARPEVLKIQDENGETLLHILLYLSVAPIDSPKVMDKYYDMVKQTLEKSMPEYFEIQNYEGETPLHSMFARDFLDFNYSSISFKYVLRITTEVFKNIWISAFDVENNKKQKPLDVAYLLRMTDSGDLVRYLHFVGILISNYVESNGNQKLLDESSVLMFDDKSSDMDIDSHKYVHDLVEILIAEKKSKNLIYTEFDKFKELTTQLYTRTLANNDDTAQDSVLNKELFNQYVSQIGVEELKLLMLLVHTIQHNMYGMERCILKHYSASDKEQFSSFINKIKEEGGLLVCLAMTSAEVDKVEKVAIVEEIDKLNDKSRLKPYNNLIMTLLSLYTYNTYDIEFNIPHPAICLLLVKHKILCKTFFKFSEETTYKIPNMIQCYKED